MNVQQIIFQQLQQQNVPVYDIAYKNAALPHILIGKAQTRNLDNLENSRREARIYIELWSDAPGMQEVKTLERSVLALLDTAQLTAIDSRVEHFEIVRTTHETRRQMLKLFAVAVLEFRAIYKVEESV